MSNENIVEMSPSKPVSSEFGEVSVASPLSIRHRNKRCRAVTAQMFGNDEIVADLQCGSETALSGLCSQIHPKLQSLVPADSANVDSIHIDDPSIITSTAAAYVLDKENKSSGASGSKLSVLELQNKLFMKKIQVSAYEIEILERELALTKRELNLVKRNSREHADGFSDASAVGKADAYTQTSISVLPPPVSTSTTGNTHSQPAYECVFSRSTQTPPNIALDVDELTHRLKEAQDEIEKFKSEKENFTPEIERLKQEVEAAKKAVEKSECVCKRLTHERKTLERNVSLLTDALNKANGVSTKESDPVAKPKVEPKFTHQLHRDSEVEKIGSVLSKVQTSKPSFSSSEHGKIL